jgi:hypothetical protein
MPLWTPVVSRVRAAIRPEPNSPPPARISHVPFSTGSGTDSRSPRMGHMGSDDVVEIPDSEEESDWEALATTPEGASSTRTARGIPVGSSQSPRNRSLCDLSDVSEGPSDTRFDSMDIWSDQDDDDVPRPPSASVDSVSTSLERWKEILSNPRSSVWEGRNGAKVAVVLSKRNKGTPDKASTLRALSASRQNVIAGTDREDKFRDEVFTSRNGKGIHPWHYGGELEIFRSLSYLPLYAAFNFCFLSVIILWALLKGWNTTSVYLPVVQRWALTSSS